MKVIIYPPSSPSPLRDGRDEPFVAMYAYEEDRAIKHICRNYQIPDAIAFRLPNSDKWACSLSRKKVCFYEGAFQASLHFLMHVIREFLGFLSITPAQLAPNAWRMMIRTMTIQSTSSKGEDSFILGELLYCYKLSQWKKSYLSPRET